MKSTAVQRVKEGGLLTSLIVKRQLEMCAVVLATHVLTELGSPERRTLGSLCSGTPTALPTLRLLPAAWAASFTDQSKKVFSKEQGQRGSRWKTHLTILKWTMACCPWQQCVFSVPSLSWKQMRLIFCKTTSRCTLLYNSITTVLNEIHPKSDKHTKRFVLRAEG